MIDKINEKDNQKGVTSAFGLIWRLALIIFAVEFLIMVILWEVPQLP